MLYILIKLNYNKSGDIMSEINYVIFDMDGVIVDSEPVIMKAALDALKSGGVPATLDDFTEFIGAGEEHFIIGPCRRAGREELIDGITEKMFENFENNIADMRVFPSAKPLIKELKKRGLTLALVSSAAERKLMASLKAAGIDPKDFEVILSGSDVTEKKPSPLPYLLAAERLSAEPGRCLVIEDALSGVKSAKRAGMSCAAVSTSFGADELKAAGADHVTDDIIKVLDVIK